MRRRNLWPRRLRTRLLFAFTATAVLAAAAAAWAGAGAASTALLTAGQRQFTQTFVTRINEVTPNLDYPPSQATLERLRTAVGPNSRAEYGDLRSADYAGRLVTDALRTAVRVQQRLITQRVVVDGSPWLLIGTPIVLTAPDGSRTPSGVTVYSAYDLSDVDDQVAGLTRSAGITAAAALPLAIALALLAAGSVLRPVRQLRDTARRLARGELAARTTPQGVDELAQLTTTINEMADALQKMQADTKRFAADVSHELRTPLTTLTAVMDVLEATTGEMTPAAREPAELAITETHRLVRLVEDLVEVSRFDAGTAPVRLEEIDVAGAIRDGLRARDWLGRVELRAPDGLRMRADRRRLDVIIANLAGNALRHGAPPVRVAVSATAQTVRIEVTDHGPGLTDEILPHVFDRFYKADAARTRSPGSGLGLAISLENARVHGGTLVAGNAPGGGAQFVLTLPRTLEDG